MRMLILILFMCGFAYGQDFDDESFYYRDSTNIEGGKYERVVLDSRSFILSAIKKYPNHDSLAYLDYASKFAMDSINSYRKKLGLDTLLMDPEIQYGLVEDCVFDFYDKIKKPVLVKFVFEDLCKCKDCYQSLTEEIFEHADVMRNLKSKNLQAFYVAIFNAGGNEYLYCIETQGILFNIRTYIE